MFENTKYNKEFVKMYQDFVVEKDMLEPIKKIIEKYVAPGKSILEIGSGLGVDYSYLSKEYEVTGSDYSESFIEILEKKFGKKFSQINTLDFKTDVKYDVIFSNKVLHHISPELMSKAFEMQSAALKPGGLLIHTYWLGKGKEVIMDIPFYSYQPNETSEKAKGFETLEIVEYIEDVGADDDSGKSFVIVLKKS